MSKLMEPTLALLLVWVGLSVILLTVVAYVRWNRKKKLDIQLTEVISLVTITLGTIASYRLLFKVVSSQELRNLLELDELAVLVIGVIAVSWVSVKEVWKSLL